MPTGDPLLKTHAWRRIRQHWQQTATHCALCGIELDTRTGATGRRAMDVGHIVSRHAAKRAGWTEAEINALSNTRPECRTCSRSVGAKIGNAARPKRERVTSRNWFA